LGIKAKKMFEERGITVVTGATGEAADVIVKYLDGTLVTENNSCDH
jgi:predicted Fe-Mo cluster-binding NifX family protein